MTSSVASVPDVESEEECTVSGALALALCMARVAGVAPLRFRRARVGWRVRVSHDVHLYGQTLAVILSLLTLSVILTDILIDSNGSIRTDTDEYYTLTFVGYAVMSMVALGGAVTGGQRMSGMVASLNQVQKVTLELNYYRPYRTIEKKKWLILIVMVFGGFFCISFDYALSLYEIITKNEKVMIGAAYIFFEFLGVLQLLLEIQYALITLTIRTTLEQLNGCLEDLLAEIKSNDFRRTSLKLVPGAVHHLAYQLSSVCEAVRRVDSTHGLMALLYIYAIIYHLLDTLYNSINSHFTVLVLNHYNNNPIRQVMWGLLHFICLAAIVEPCQGTQDAIEKTKELVSQMTLEAPPRGGLAAELALFFRHLALNDTAYCPMNMFTMNRQLVLTMVSAITTYLVIIENF